MTLKLLRFHYSDRRYFTAVFTPMQIDGHILMTILQINSAYFVCLVNQIKKEILRSQFFYNF